MIILIYISIVIFSVLQSAATKLFNQHSTNSSVFNAIKSITSLALFALMAVSGFKLHFPTFLFGNFFGACLCLSMYSGYRALCLGSMALTSMMVSFSVIIPLFWGVTVGKESLNFIQILALFLLLTAIVLTNSNHFFQGKTSHPKSKYLKWSIFVSTTFLSNGICSILQKQHQALYPESYNEEFMFFAMMLCVLIFSGISLFKNSVLDIKKTRGKWLGALSGVANGLANYLTLSLAGFENASILFPVISAGTLLGAVLCGKFLFKEKLKVNHYFALGCGMLAVVFFKL